MMNLFRIYTVNKGESALISMAIGEPGRRYRAFFEALSTHSTVRYSFLISLTKCAVVLNIPVKLCHQNAFNILFVHCQIPR